MTIVKITDPTNTVATIDASELTQILDALQWDRWWTDTFDGSVELQDGQVVILTPTEAGRFMVSWFGDDSQQRVVLSTGSDDGQETTAPGAEPMLIRRSATLDPSEIAQMLQDIALSDQPLRATLSAARREVAFFEDVLVDADE